MSKNLACFALAALIGQTTAVAQEPLRAGEDVPYPKRLKNVFATYPEPARLARVPGLVFIDCVIGTDGKVVETHVLRGDRLFVDAAVAAARQWSYEPTNMEGRPVSIIVTSFVFFSMSTEPPVALFTAALGDPNEHVRKQAAITLGNLHERSAVKRLTLALQDEKEPVRRAAREALEKIQKR